MKMYVLHCFVQKNPYIPVIDYNFVECCIKTVNREEIASNTKEANIQCRKKLTDFYGAHYAPLVEQMQNYKSSKKKMGGGRAIKQSGFDQRRKKAADRIYCSFETSQYC